MNPRSLSLLMLGAIACSSSPSMVSSGSGGVSGVGNVGSGGSVGSGGGERWLWWLGAGGSTTQGTGGDAAPVTSTGGAMGTGWTPGTGGASAPTGGTTVPASTGGTAGSAVGGRGGTPAAPGSGGAAVGGAAAPSGFAVVTDRYDIARSGSNTNETILNTSNVAAGKFGLLFSRTIVGQVFGQPLYVGGLMVNGAKHNVVYVATQHNMVYAFDADGGATDDPLWSKSLGTSMTLGSGADYDPGCTDMRNEVGITSTPVISLVKTSASRPPSCTPT